MKILRFVLFFFSLIFWGCAPKTEPLLSPLASPPSWSLLEAFQETMTQEEFTKLLNTLYLAEGSAEDFITLKKDHALIQTSSKNSSPVFKLRFAPDCPRKAGGSAAGGPPPARSPATRDEHCRGMATRQDPLSQTGGPTSNQSQRDDRTHSLTLKEKPLKGIKIALDPGHLGGKWAKMEKRWFQLGNFSPVVEGDLTLLVAKHLKTQLENLGATVELLRQDSTPLTSRRPDPSKGPEDELLFYRTAEIRARAKKINEEIKPDFTLCIHFNAENWGDPQNPTFVGRNHLHLIVNGAYLPSELRYEDVRLEMFKKLLSRSHEMEIALSEKIAKRLASETKLLPCLYPGPAVKKVGLNPYVWARNLLANRLYEGPVIYLEAYVMNNPDVFARIQAGDYEGKKYIGETWRPSITREYAQGVTLGIVDYFEGRDL